MAVREINEDKNTLLKENEEIKKQAELQQEKTQKLEEIKEKL